MPRERPEVVRPPPLGQFRPNEIGRVREAGLQLDIVFQDQRAIPAFGENSPTTEEMRKRAADLAVVQLDAHREEGVKAREALLALVFRERRAINGGDAFVVEAERLQLPIHERHPLLVLLKVDDENVHVFHSS